MATNNFIFMTDKGVKLLNMNDLNSQKFSLKHLTENVIEWINTDLMQV